MRGGPCGRVGFSGSSKPTASREIAELLLEGHTFGRTQSQIPMAAVDPEPIFSVWSHALLQKTEEVV